MRIFTKAIKEITIEDIQQLIEVGYTEDIHIEYKRALAGNSWESGQNNISDKSKKKLAREIVAFANTDGGIIIIGVGETDEKPSRPKEIFPIPKVLELSDRIRRSMYDHIEPKIQNLQIRGILTKAEEGILIIKVERSYQSPHRSLLDKECYTRRNEESTTMTMREIKDLTVRSLNVFDDLQKRMTYRSNLFKENVKDGRRPYNYRPTSSQKSAVRISLLPFTNEIIFPGIYKKRSKQIFDNPQRVKFNQEVIELKTIHNPYRKKPTVRGVLHYGDSVNLELKEDGLLECIFVSTQKKALGKDYSEYEQSGIQEYLIVHGKFISGLIMKTLNILDELKEEYEVFYVQYVLEIEIWTSKPSKNKFIILPLHYTVNHLETYPVVEQANLKLPQFSYSNEEDKEQIINQFNQDLAHAGGKEYYPKFKILD